MTWNRTTSVTITALLAAILGSCYTIKPSPNTPTTGRPQKTNVATVAPTHVTVRFFGSISHILLGGSENRAVLLRQAHKAVLRVFTSDVTEASLKKIWPAADVDCSIDGMCTVPLENTALQLASDGTAIASAKPTTEESFMRFVPGVTKVTGTTDRLKPDALVKTAPEKTNALIAAWMDLPGGALTALPYDWTAIFEPDTEGRTERRFGKEIVLDTTIALPSLKVDRGGGNWQTLPFEASGGTIELSVLNGPVAEVDDPPKTGMVVDHFRLHYDLIDGATGTRPVVRLRQKEAPTAGDAATQARFVALLSGAPFSDHNRRSELGDFVATLFAAEVPGCSNSQWP
jgi:hypothetical protein